LPEPGWWEAFVVDKNLVLTRTPDHPGRKPHDPEQKETDLNRRRPVSEPRPSASVQPSASPTVEQLLSPPQFRPQPDPVVHHQLAQLQAEFEANPGGPSESGIMPEAGTPTASGSTQTVSSAEALYTSEAEVAASFHNEDMTPEGVIPRLQNAFWTAPVSLTFSWQASSWQATPSPVQPTASDEPSPSLMADATADDAPDSIYGAGADEAIEDAKFVEVEEPSVPIETAAVADIEVADLDLGYLALYPDVLCSVIQPTLEPASIAAAARIAVAPVEAADNTEMAEPDVCAGAEAVHCADPVIRVSAPESDQHSPKGLESSPEAPIDEDASTAPEIRSDLITIGEVNEASMEVETDFERQDEGEPEIEAEAEVTPPSAEIIMLPRPVTHREIIPAYELPDIGYLTEAPEREGEILTEDILEEAAGRLEKVIRDFGVRGEVIHVHPGPVVTLYEFEPAPGIKSSRVIALTEDIARSMSAVSARVAVIPGRNAIGVELPNQQREKVFLREILESEEFRSSTQKMPLCLGKTIGGEPVIADLARMPHLLVAGTTGSGKSVAINTMILSLLYRFTPEECRLIMVDPKMLELSVYDGIPHLLTPVVTDPKKAIIALRWAVREMEDRYKKMAKLGVRNIDGFNARVSEAREKGEVITRTVQTGFDKNTGELTYTEEVMDLTSLPYIVVIVDEMADLMMVAGKEIEGAIQRLAQMARAAGIHVILATQRPSVDVITGTIKANFPTRISFQVTSKIDSRTILGEMGAEQLLGQGDMLHMQGGGRIARVHGPFVSDMEVERVVAHLKRQAKPVYLEAVTAENDEEQEPEEMPVFDESEMGLGSGELFDQAVSIVLRHKKASTSYIQRRLQIGYNRAASIMERMEKEGVVGPANHAGKREILIGTGGADED
jgi:S-DNA-T family DNA segregation ATPase FtsK/SpoIIIE